MKLFTTVKEEVTKEIDVPVPSFWKYPYLNGEYIGLIDENTCISFMKTPGFNIITSQTPAACGEKILEAKASWKPVSEEEFMTAYNDFHKFLSLEPQLIER